MKGIGERIYKEGIPRTDWDWLIYPEGLYDLLLRIKSDYPHYNKIYITENGMGYKDQFEDGIIMDQPRIDYLRVYLESLSKAITAGVNVKGVFCGRLWIFSHGQMGITKGMACFMLILKPRSVTQKNQLTGTSWSVKPKRLFNK